MNRVNINTTDYPDFTVLMSVYSGDKSENLLSAIRSVVNQTIEPKEILLVGDGVLGPELNKAIHHISQDLGSLFRFIQLPQNKGLGGALNAGLAATNTEIVARMDSDDVAIPERFELQIKEFARDSDLVVLGGQIEEFRDPDISDIVGYRRVPLDGKEIQKFIKFRSPVNHPTAMFRSTEVRKLGGYKDIYHLEDYLLWAELVAKGNTVRNLPVVLVYMRSGSDLYSRRGGIRYLASYIELRKRLHGLKIINYSEMLVGDFLFFLSSLSPNWIRALLYKHILHRK